MPTLYRITKYNPARLEDFMSEYLMGRPPRGVDDKALMFWFGVSLWSLERQARRKAAEWPRLGKFITELEVPESNLMVQWRTLGTGHRTLWALPRRLLDCATRTFPV